MTDNDPRELSSELRRELNRALDVPDDIDAERALTRVRARGVQHASRRRWLLVAAPIAAAATAIAVLFAVRAGLSNHTPHPPAATPPPPATATGALPIGEWVHHVTVDVTTSEGAKTIGGIWIIRATSPTRAVIDIRPDDKYGSGQMRYD